MENATRCVSLPIDHPGITVITVPLKLMGLLTSEPAAWRSPTGESFVKEFLSQLMFSRKQREIGSCHCVRSQKEIGREERSPQLKPWLPTVAAMIYTFIDNPPQLSSTVHSDIPVPNMKPQAPGGLDQRLHLGIKL